MRCPKCQTEGAVLVRAGAMRCTTCGVVDPDGQATTEEEPLRTFAPPPEVDALRPLPPGVQRNAGAWRILVFVPTVGGVIIGVHRAFDDSRWIALVLVSFLAAIALSWDEIKRSFRA